MDSIYLDGIECWTHIGVSDEERRTEQLVHVCVKLFTDTETVAKTDDVRKGIDYSDVAEHVKQIAKKERKTIEALAKDIAESLLSTFHPGSVKVSVWKRPLPTMARVCLTISRP